MADTVVGRLVVPVVCALLAGALAWAAGLDAGHAVLVGLAVLLTAGAGRALGAGQSGAPGWPEPPEDTSGTGCHLVPLQARLVHEAEGDRERFERTLAARLRRLTAGRLHAAGYDPADPGVRALLGAQVFDPLRPGHAPRHPAALVARLLDRLDDLDPPPREDTHDEPSSR